MAEKTADLKLNKQAKNQVQSDAKEVKDSVTPAAQVSNDKTKVEEVEGNDYHGNIIKRFKIYIRYPNGIVNDFTIDESFLYKPENAMTLYGVYKWVKPYLGKIKDSEFIILCLARWFVEVGKEWKYI